MKKNIDVLRKLSAIMLLAAICVALLECDSLQGLRREIVVRFSFVQGKRVLLSNIFLGIFASAFCMYVGELINLKHLKKDLENEIRKIFEDIWIKIYFKNGTHRQNYIANSQIIILYQDKILKLSEEYVSRKSKEHYIINYLKCIFLYYKAIYENEYMKNSNCHLYKEYMNKMEELFEGDLVKLYSSSLNDEQVMEIRKTYEKLTNEQNKYITQRDEHTNSYIEEIEKVEEKLAELYNNM